MDRQDLDVSLLRPARASRVRISFGTDAHRTDQFSFVEFALASAIEAGIPREGILNLMAWQELLAWSKSPAFQCSTLNILNIIPPVLLAWR